MELLQGKRLLNDLVERDQIWPRYGGGRHLPLFTWDEHRKALAGGDDAWNEIADGFAELDELNWQARALDADDISDEQLAKLKDQVREALPLIARAEKALRQAGR